MRQSGELVELRTELEHVRNYLYIMNKKYDDRLEVDEYIPDQRVLPCRIPKLLLQPVVENCIRHGFGEDRREGAIRISVTTVRRGLLIAICDSGKGMDADELKRLRRQLDKPDEKNGNIGLYNINHRIKLNFGQDFGIRVRSTRNAGTCVYLVVPRIE
ncbi:Sensor histidine kinase YpdA [compost metagenome]